MTTQNLHFTRAAMLVEINGEVLSLNLSNEAWNAVLEVANADGGGQLQAAKVPNQKVLDALNHQETSVKLIRELEIGSDASDVDRAYATGWNNHRTASHAALQDLAELIKQAQSHMVRTPEADKISVALSQYIDNL